MSASKTSRAQEVAILTGQSGSGKSTAIRALEDSGYFCVDNIPLELVDQMLEIAFTHEKEKKIGVVLDIRQARFTQDAPDLIRHLRRKYPSLRVLFLDAQLEVVIRRYSETRRLHPLDDGRGLRSAIESERQLLTPLREMADQLLDTSVTSAAQLRAHISKVVATGHGDRMRLAVMSFGFKHGVPLEADMVLDVRFLPNPYFVEGMREKTGKDTQVAAYVMEQPEAQAFFERVLALVLFLLPQYQKEGKRYFTLAIGCTGGRHRSVALTRALTEALSREQWPAELRHRDTPEAH